MHTVILELHLHNLLYAKSSSGSGKTFLSKLDSFRRVKEKLELEKISVPSVSSASASPEIILSKKAAERAILNRTEHHIFFMLLTVLLKCVIIKDIEMTAHICIMRTLTVSEVRE